MYDPSKTASENLMIMSQAGLDICEKTFYNYVGKYIPKPTEGITHDNTFNERAFQFNYDLRKQIILELPKNTQNLGNSDNTLIFPSWTMPNFNPFGC